MKSLKAKFRKTDVSNVTCASGYVCFVHATVCAHVHVCMDESLSVHVCLEQSAMIFGRIPQFLDCSRSLWLVDIFCRKK